MKYWLISLSLLWPILSCCDELMDLTQALKKVVDDTELFAPGSGKNKIRIIVQSDDYRLYDGMQLLALVRAADREAGGAIIKGIPEIIRFDPENPNVIKDLKLSEYKTIFVAGWKPKIDPQEKKCYDQLRFFAPELNTRDGRVRDFFNWYGASFMVENAVAVVLVLLDNSLGSNPKFIQQSLEYKLVQASDRRLEDGYGPISFAYAQSPASELTFFALQNDKLESYPGGFAAWLKKPLLAKTAVEQLEKDEKQRLEKEHSDITEATKNWEQQYAKAKALEKQKQQEFELKRAKANSFVYNKKPKVRLIAQASHGGDAAKAAQDLSNFLVSQNSGAKLFTGTPEIVMYNFNVPRVNLLDGEYKNIFVFGWDSHQGQQSTVFFREVYFSSYSVVASDQFSPVTTLLVFVPQNQEAFENVVKFAWAQNQVFKAAPFNSLGGKMVAVGQFVDTSAGLNTQVFDIAGVNNLVDWLKYGVK